MMKCVKNRIRYNNFLHHPELSICMHVSMNIRKNRETVEKPLKRKQAENISVHIQYTKIFPCSILKKARFRAHIFVLILDQ